MPAMKWWGWGEEGVAFTHRDKPALAPFIHKSIGVDVRVNGAAPISFDHLRVAEPNLPPELRTELEQAVGEGFVSSDALDRVVHSRGKSLRDLIRQRHGELARLPDVIVRPANQDEVSATVQAALRADAVIIPFGGGSSISGSLEAPTDESRPVISVDLERLDQVLDIDAGSRLARVQAGVFGPHLEEQLAARGYTFGHFPDSFPHSTLGGWIATRSSGMQSDRYGDIADMAKGLRVVTPAGLLVTRPVPAASNGPQRAPDGSGQRGSPRDHHRGHGARAADSRAAHDPRLPVPDLGRRPGGDARSGRERALGVGDPRLGRERDAVLVRHACQSQACRPPPIGRAFRTTSAGDGDGTSRQMCLSFIGYEGSERHVTAQRHAVGKARQAPRRAVHRLGPRRPLRPEEVRHPLHPRLPARPRSGGRRLGDGDAVEQPHAAVRRGHRRGKPRVRRAGHPGLRHVPPLAQLPRGRLPLLHVRLQGDERTTHARRVRRGQVRHPAGVRRQRRPRSRTTMPSAPNMPGGCWRTSRPRGSRCSAPCSTGSTRVAT